MMTSYDSDTNDSDLSNEVFSESSTVAGDNGKHNSLFIDGSGYVARPTRKSDGKKKSNVWKLGVELKKVDDDTNSWQCLICKRKDKIAIYTATATTGAFRHLESEHGVVEKDKRLVRVEKPKRLESEPPEDSPIVHSFNHHTNTKLFSRKLIDQLRLLFLQ